MLIRVVTFGNVALNEYVGLWIKVGVSMRVCMMCGHVNCVSLQEILRVCSQYLVGNGLSALLGKRTCRALLLCVRLLVGGLYEGTVA